MTSSLVGSEMCIRDRMIRDPDQQYQQILANPVPPRIFAQTHTHIKGTVTVSYTHLTLPTICSV
eukprot:2580438-Prorocentrum_lima.AAC.1